MALQYGNARLSVALETPSDGPVTVAALGGTPIVAGATSALVEVLVLGQGRMTNQTRHLLRTLTGANLRYVDHFVGETGELLVRQRTIDGSLSTETRLMSQPDLGSLTITTTVTNTGRDHVVIQALTAGVIPIPFVLSATSLVSGISSWCAENRWRIQTLEDAGLVDCSTTRMDILGSASIVKVGTSTWTTDGALPTGALEDSSSGHGLAWQIANNGGWRWELDSITSTPGHFALAASGPTDADHQWWETLAPGESTSSPELVITYSTSGWQGAIGELTRHRRLNAAQYTSHEGRTALVFNDYMNTLNADPTDEKLLPLIRAAADAGAEYFCIDAGWYDDGGDWWPSVGEWMPSRGRFGALHLDGILNYITEQGMAPGLWVEPEVIGVHSPMAQILPDGAFIQRDGIRVVEHGRYFLDLTCDVAREHLDQTFDRLVGMGAAFFKLDYNVTPGPGGTTQAGSIGAGLQDHCDAYVDWFDALRRRHPTVLIENCGSGAMRQDWRQASRFDLQSTSDQQDYLLYPAIAVGAPMMLLPEQSGNWAYAQPDMSDELIAFIHVTGLSGRPYFSGHLDRMSDAQLALVREAADVWKSIRDAVIEAIPFWPAGLPRWTDDQLALGLRCPDGTSYIAVWNRAEAPGTIRLHLAARTVEQVYPAAMTGWSVQVVDEQTVEVLAAAGPSARLLRINPSLTPH